MDFDSPIALAFMRHLVEAIVSESPQFNLVRRECTGT